MHIFVLIVAAFLSLECHATSEAPTPGSEIKTNGAEAKIRYSTQTIRRMSAHQLLSLRDELAPLILKARKLTGREELNNFNVQTITALSEFQLKEVFELLLELYRAELKRFSLNVGGMSQILSLRLINAIERIGTSAPKEFLEEFRDLLEETRSRSGVNLVAKALVPRLEEVAASLSTRQMLMLGLKDLLGQKGLNDLSSIEYMRSMETTLRARIIGQPEAVDALLDIEWRAKLYGKGRTKPDLVYLMGLSGTGREAIAMAFTDALNGFSGAHRAHMFAVPPLKRFPDLWSLMGSSTGFLGSEGFPDFLNFLVIHSGGRYKTMTEKNSNGKDVTKIIENPEYKGELLEGYSPPESAVIFVDDFQDWSREIKDSFLRRAIADGYFKVNSPNGGLSKLFLPVRFIVASTEGTSLLAAREANGQRFGKELTYTQLHEKWEYIHGDVKALKREIMNTNAAGNSGEAAEAARGISQSLLSTIPDRYVILLRPLSPEDLQLIIRKKLQEMAAKVRHFSNLLQGAELTWDDDLPQALQSYDYAAEENARPVLAQLENMIEAPLLDAIRSGKIRNTGGLKLKLSILNAPDGTRELSLSMTTSGTDPIQLFRQPIRYTLKDIPPHPITDERIDELGGLESQMKGVVFGIDPILERISQRIRSIENRSRDTKPRSANMLLLAGPSSVGKTETAKQLASALLGSVEDLVTFDFGRIQTLRAFESEILGGRDAQGNPVPSRFMKHYDRNNGRIVVALDELPNVRDQELLKSLYDLFREATMTTFSDNVPRPMTKVTFIITGNPGLEQYKDVPRNIPMEVQMNAWAEIHRQLDANFEAQRAILERFFPEPLIARLGRTNIFFVPPHNYKSLRQVTQLKLGQSLTTLRATTGRRGWTVGFANAEGYSHFIDTIIAEGFNLRDQGASIDSFIKDDIEAPLESLLLTNKIPSGSDVTIRYVDSTPNDDPSQPGTVNYRIDIPGRLDPLMLKLRRPFVEKPLPPYPEKQVLTAFHESGHSVARKVIFADAFRATKLSIIPGVDRIGENFVYYGGIAVAVQERNLPSARDWVIRNLAVLLAGETAERLVTRGATHSTGKSNDIERATRLAQDAIVRYGLSEKWGLQAMVDKVDFQSFVASLSEGRKALLERETDRFLNEGRHLAQETLEANFDTLFVPLAMELATKGEMDKPAIEAFYDGRTPVDPFHVPQWKRQANRIRTRARALISRPIRPETIEFQAGIPQPKSIADIQAMSHAKKLAQYTQVALPEDVPLIGTKCAVALGAPK